MVADYFSLGKYSDSWFCFPKEGDIFSIYYTTNNKYIPLLKSSGLVDLTFVCNGRIELLHVILESMHVMFSQNDIMNFVLDSNFKPFGIDKNFVARLKISGGSLKYNELGDSIILSNAYKFGLSNFSYSSDKIKHISGSYKLRLKFDKDNKLSVLPTVHSVKRTLNGGIQIHSLGHESNYKNIISSATYLNHPHLSAIHDYIISRLDLVGVDENFARTSLVNYFSVVERGY